MTDMLPLPLWKLPREIRRLRGDLRYFWLRHVTKRMHFPFRGLEVPVERSGMTNRLLKQFLGDRYETPEIIAVDRIVRPGDKILELGAGMGIVTALAARAALPKGQVLSFEANSGMIPDTKAFLAVNGVKNAEIRNGVLVPQAAEGESRTFYIADSFAVSSLLAEGAEMIATETVAAFSLNKVVDDFKPDILICDIEGGEAELIPALDAKGIRAVIIELHPDRLSVQQVKEIDASLLKFGLRPSVVSPRSSVLIFSR